MTTETKQGSRSRGSTVLVGAALATVLLGALGTLAAGLVDGRPAAQGTLVGAAVVVGIFGLGSFVVNQVAALMPALALLVALMTYTLQVLLLAVLFLGLSGSGLLDRTLDRGWLAATIIAGTFVWLAAQLVLTTRLRIPAYDLPEQPPAGSEAPEAGAR